MAVINVEFSTEIQADIEKTWDILADVEGWPKWQGTPLFVNSKTPAPIKEGSLFEAKRGGVKWQLTVLEAQRPQKLRWIGEAQGLKAIHEWEFQKQEGRIVATAKETVSGWMAILLYFLVRARTQSSVKKWLADLKAVAESP